LLSSGILGAAENPDEWLDQMAAAVVSLNYQGMLVYMRPGQAETFAVYHRVAGSDVTERVVAMDGDGAEIIRTVDEVICIFPAQQKVVVDKRKGTDAKQNPLTASLPEYTPSVAENYDLTLEAGHRVVGRDAVVVSISPHDGFRYGYRIWLDEQTAMPLKTQLLGEDDSMPVEELFFTSLQLTDVLPKDMMQPGFDTSNFTWVRHGKPDGQIAAQDAEINWRATQLPAGFMKTDAKLEYMAHADYPRMHLVFSDGLASVSVFVDVGVAASEQAEGLTMLGAAHAYSVMVGGQLVTAMGEVPAQTVRQIALSLEPVAKGQ